MGLAGGTDPLQWGSLLHASPFCEVGMEADVDG